MIDIYFHILLCGLVSQPYISGGRSKRDIHVGNGINMAGL